MEDTNIRNKCYYPSFIAGIWAAILCFIMNFFTGVSYINGTLVPIYNFQKFTINTFQSGLILLIIGFVAATIFWYLISGGKLQTTKLRSVISGVLIGFLIPIIYIFLKVIFIPNFNSRLLYIAFIQFAPLFSFFAAFIGGISGFLLQKILNQKTKYAHN